MGLFDSSSSTEASERQYLWRRAAPGMFNAVDAVNQATQQPLTFFPGQTYADQTAAELESIEALKAGAGAYPGMLQGFMDPTVNAWQGALGAPQAALGMGLQDVMNNPALTGAADAIQSRVNRNLTEGILPNLTQQFMGYGGLGGTRQGLAEGLAAGRTSDVLAEQLANMYGNAWAQGLGAETSRYLGGLNAQQGAMGMLPGLVGLGLSEYTQPATLLGKAGTLERAEEQRGIDEAMQRHQFAQMEPYQRAALGLGLLAGPAETFGPREMKSETTSSPSTWSNIGSLMSTAGTIAGSIFGGPIGGMAGGALGSMIGGGMQGGGAGAGAGAAGGSPGNMFGPWNLWA